MPWEWITTSWMDIGMSLGSLLAMYFAIILYTRLTGLRSFSKMSASDFAMTIALGSMFASVAVNPTPPLLLGLCTVGGLFGGQWAYAMLRQNFSPVKRLENQPVLLMAGSKMLEDNLRRTNVTQADVYGKLREANVLNLEQVRAVVFETTGDISVLHSDDDEMPIDMCIFSGIVDGELLQPND